MGNNDELMGEVSGGVSFAVAPVRLGELTGK